MCFEHRLMNTAGLQNIIFVCLVKLFQCSMHCRRALNVCCALRQCVTVEHDRTFLISQWRIHGGRGGRSPLPPPLEASSGSAPVISYRIYSSVHITNCRLCVRVQPPTVFQVFQRKARKEMWLDEDRGLLFVWTFMYKDLTVYRVMDVE